MTRRASCIGQYTLASDVVMEIRARVGYSYHINIIRSINYIIEMPKIVYIAVALLIAIGGILLFMPRTESPSAIAGFEECMAAGYDVLASNPRRCTTPSGVMFFERVAATPGPTPGGGDCIVTGCSAQLCAEESLVTTCEYREEYACYKTARCERQPAGGCGWTPTEELLSCLKETREEGLESGIPQ